MHVALAPGERLLPAARTAAEELLARPGIAAVLLPLAPEGETALARAARRHLATWDARLIHAQTFFAPAARVAARTALPGPRNADAAPALADALARGERVEALRGGAVAARIAEDLGAWMAHFRAEGAAWAALAARDPRFGAFAPRSWARHNLVEAPSRTIEILEAVRRPDPLVWLLHVARESAWSSGGSQTG